jgi:hypothetical protein
MIKHNQDGGISAVTLSLGITVVLLVGAISFAAWAFSGRQDYKNNTDQKIADAVTIAKQKEDSAKDVLFAETEKNPLRTYEGPEAYGSIRLQYPKTWSGYVDSTGAGTALVDGYFYPGVVPSVSSQSSVFALHVQVINLPYSQALTNLSSAQQNGKVTVEAYALPKVPKAIGVKAIGTFQNGKAGEEVLLPLRNQTVQISTDGSLFTSDFEKNILPNFTFSP